MTQSKLMVKPEDYGIEQTKANDLIGNLPQIVSERDELEKQYNEVIKMDIENPETWKRAREVRLLVQKNRTQGILKWHEKAKEYFLRGGQFVDAKKKVEIEVNLYMEKNLEEIEKYEVIQEQKRIAELQNTRVKEIEPFLMGSEIKDFGNMPDDVWEAYFSAKKKAFEDEQLRLKKEEEERIERERLSKLKIKRESELKNLWNFVPDQHPAFESLSIEEWDDFLAEMKNAKESYDLEQERIRKENERLQKEAEERERIAKIEAEKRAKEEAERKAKAEAERKEREEKERKEREAHEAAMKAEREKAAKLQAELEAKAEAERKAKEAEEARIQAELNKGDEEKVFDLIKDLQSLKTKYTFKSEKNINMYAHVIVLIDNVINQINGTI